MSAKVENYCMGKRTRQISVDANERACINCIWYERHYRLNRGNTYGYVPINSGYCLRLDKHRGPLCQPCKDFEKEEIK